METKVIEQSIIIVNKIQKASYVCRLQSTLEHINILRPLTSRVNKHTKRIKNFFVC